MLEAMVKRGYLVKWSRVPVLYWVSNIDLKKVAIGERQGREKVEGVGKVKLQLHQVVEKFCSLVQVTVINCCLVHVTVHCNPALVITHH